MNFEQVNIEDNDEAVTAETVEIESADYYSALSEKIAQIKLLKLKQREAEVEEVRWNDSNAESRSILERGRKNIQNQISDLSKEIFGQFDILVAEVEAQTEIQSETTNYEPERLIGKINLVRDEAMKGRKVDPAFITRALGLRDKLPKLADLVLELNQLAS